MQPERKARLQVAIDALRQVQKDIYDSDNSLYEEAVKAQQMFDVHSNEYDILDGIAGDFSNADTEIQEAIEILEGIFGADGADDEPDSDDDEPDSDDDDSDYDDSDDDNTF